MADENVFSISRWNPNGYAACDVIAATTKRFWIMPDKAMIRNVFSI